MELCMTLLWSAAASATTYVVRPDGIGPYPTIQAAINAAVDGDVIELVDGVFRGNGNRDIDLLGKAITVRSRGGDPLGCTIDCEGSESEPHRGFYLHTAEDSCSVLEGLTVSNGWAGGTDGLGGGLLCRDASPHISRCVFFNNTAHDGGGAFSQGYSHPRLANCAFGHNAADGAGGGVGCTDHVNLTMTDCLFERNIANEGAAIGCTFLCPPTLVRCTFFENSAFSGGGALSSDYYCSPRLLNCTLAANAAPTGGGLRCAIQSSPVLTNTVIAFSAAGEAIRDSGDPMLTCCDVYGNEGGDWVGCIADQWGTNGNISADPRFCDLPFGDLTVAPDSPCAPDHSPPGCGLIGAWPVGCEEPQVVHDLPIDQLARLWSQPNPSMGETTISYQLPPNGSASGASISIYNVAGRLVRTLQVQPSKDATGLLRWDGTDDAGRALSGGIYMLRLAGGGGTVTERIIKIR
jgi:predicted outer membrane repeat protein